MKKREAEIEMRPEILFGEKNNQRVPTVHEAAQRYLSEMPQPEYASNKTAVIRLLGERSLGVTDYRAAVIA